MTRAILALALSGCLLDVSESPQGVTYACRYELGGELLHAEQCGPVGDALWVIFHFDFEIDSDTEVRCSTVPRGLCTYDPNHLGWAEVH